MWTPSANIFGEDAFAPGELPKIDLVAVVSKILVRFERFDSLPVESTDEFAQHAAMLWRQGDALPVEAQTRDGRWKLLTSHPRPDGGVALVSTDITEMKRAQIAHLEERGNPPLHHRQPSAAGLGRRRGKQADPLRKPGCIEHARSQGGRREPQDIAAHFLDPAEFEEIRALAGKQEIVRDREIQLRRTDGSTVWCSTNCRRGVYHGRPSLVIGVLDITERKQREDLFGFLIKNHPLPVWMNDAGTGEVIYQSEAAARLFGLGEESDRKAPHRLADHFVDREQYVEIGRELMRAGVVENCEALLKDADGQEFWANGNLRVVEFQGRRVVLAGIADVTKQKKRNAEVALAREMLANAIESLSEGFALYDEDHRLVMCNRAYRELNEPVAELIKPGMKWMDMLRESVRRGVYVDAIGREDEWLNDRVRNRTKFQSRYEADLGNGKWHSVSMHSTDLGGFVVTRADISERKKAEAAEREATALLQKVLDACPTPTRMSTIEGETLYRNPASKELYGDRPTIADHYVDPADRETLVDTLLENGRIDDFRVRMYDADDGVFWGSHFGAPDRFPGTAGDRLQHHQHHRHDRCPGADPAGKRAADRRDRVAWRGFCPLRQGRLPGAGQQPLPQDARHQRRRPDSRGELVRFPAHGGGAQPVSRAARKDRRMAGRAGAGTGASSASRNSSTPTASGSSSRTARPAKAASWSPASTSPSASGPNSPPRKPTKWSARFSKPARSTSR